MIIHPVRDRVRMATCGGRLLEDTLGFVGQRIQDPDEPKRAWRIDSFHLPIPGRLIGGVRARLIDSKGFVSFCNQRDLEVLVGEAEEGDWCSWLGKDYVGPRHRDWVGLCLDSEDLKDDLFVREVELRAAQQEVNGHQVLPTGFEITRRIHKDRGKDFEELLYLRSDVNPVTGEYPDIRFDAVEDRWIRVERNEFPWRQA